jgi:hypothetical protein
MPRRELLTAAAQSVARLPRRRGESAAVLHPERSRFGDRTPTSRRPQSTRLCGSTLLPTLSGAGSCKLCGAVKKLRQGLTYRGERLVEIRRNIGETCIGRRHHWQAESCPRLVDIFERLSDLRIGHRQGRLLLIVFFVAHYLAS